MFDYLIDKIGEKGYSKNRILGSKSGNRFVKNRVFSSLIKEEILNE